MKPIVIAGPTGVGKSRLAIEIAKEVNGYIVNADSRQIYKEIPIASAQPKPDSIKNGVYIVDGVSHYMYGTMQLDSPYNVSMFNSDIEQVIEGKRIENPNQTPIIVGGTGLYIDSYIFQYSLPVDSQKNITRSTLEKMSVEELSETLGNIEERLNSSDRKNKVRLIREIEKGSNVEVSKGDMRPCTYFYINASIESIEGIIRERISQMIEDGLESEAKSIYDKYVNKKILIPKVIGIDEFSSYFRGDSTIEEVTELIYLHTRQYAKRQITWFKRNDHKKSLKFDNIERMKREAMIIVKPKT